MMTAANGDDADDDGDGNDDVDKSLTADSEKAVPKSVAH